MDSLSVGDLVHINCYGVDYDGTIVKITDSEIVLEEQCGSAKNVKIILTKHIAAVTMRVQG